MKTAILVESLNIKEVPIADGQEVYQYQEFKPKRVSELMPEDGHKVLMLDRDDTMRSVVVPIHHFNMFYEEKRQRAEFYSTVEKRSKVHDYSSKSHNVFQEIYIALTEEVQTYLRIPLDTLKTEIDVLRIDVSRKKNMLDLNKNKIERMEADREKFYIMSNSFWLRFKFLFTGRIN